MIFVALRKKPLSTPLFGSIFFFGLVIYAILTSTFYTPGWMHSPSSTVQLTANPEEFFWRIKHFMSLAILSLAASILRFPPLEGPLARLGAWYKIQAHYDDPNNLSGKTVFFMLLPMLLVFLGVGLLVLILMQFIG